MSEGLEKRNRLNVYLEGKLKEAEVTITEMKQSDGVVENIIAANNNLKSELAKKIEHISALEWVNKEQSRVITYHGLKVFDSVKMQLAGEPHPMPLLDLVEKMRQSGIRKRAKIKAKDERIVQLLKAIQAEREEKNELSKEKQFLETELKRVLEDKAKLYSEIKSAISLLEDGANISALNKLINAL